MVLVSMQVLAIDSTNKSKYVALKDPPNNEFTAEAIENTKELNQKASTALSKGWTVLSKAI
jgi:hypothetical protein